MVGLSALVVDIGSVCYESRRLQGVADAAAMASAGNLDQPTTAAQAAISASGWSRTVTPQVITGTYTPDPSQAVTARFVAGGSNPNAARVTLAEDSPLYFARIFGMSSIRLQRTATATQINLAAFTLGSRLAALDGGLGNQLLSGLTGSSISLSASDYNALLSTDIDLLSYVSALKTELGVSAATFQQTLATTTTLPHVLNALSATLAGAGNATAAAAIAKIAAVAPNTSMTLSRLADLGALGNQDHAVGSSTISVNAFATLETALQIASGARQMQLDLSSLAPGLSSVTGTLAVGSRAASSPWLALTNTGTPIITTAQTRLFLDAGLPGTTALKLVGINSVRLPIYAELAEAKAKLSSLICQGSKHEVAIDVQPSPGHVSIADVSTSNLQDMATVPTELPAMFVNVLGIKVSGSARVDTASGGWQTVNFSSSEIDARTTKTVSANGLVSGVVGSLVSGLNLNVSVGGVTITLSPLIGLVKPILTSIASLLDPLVTTLLNTLGIHVGQADIRIDGTRCGVPSLVA